MKVPYSEGVATHTGPEPCGDVREDMAEALTGECAGLVLSHERKYYFRVPTASVCTEGNTDRSDNARDGLALRGRRPSACTRSLLHGNREIPHLTSEMATRYAPRIRKEHVGDERVWEVGQVHITEEAFEQGRRYHAACGEGRGKGPDQGESVTAKQVPDTVPGKGDGYGQP